MPVSNDIKEQRAKLKGAPLKDKWQYFLDYYKWPTIAVLVGILVVIFIARDVIRNSKPIYVSAVFINSHALVDNTILQDDFMQYKQLNPKDYNVTIDNTTSIRSGSTDEMSYYNDQKVYAMLMAKEIDCMIVDESLFPIYKNQGFFEDLSLVLTEEQMEKYKDRIIYETSDDSPTPYPMAIDVTDIPFFEEIGAYTTIRDSQDSELDQVYFTIIVNSLDKSHAVEYLEYIYDFTVQ